MMRYKFDLENIEKSTRNFHMTSDLQFEMLL